VDRAVRVWAEGLSASHREVLRVGYFGSYARGDWGVGSDLDVIIVAEAFARIPFVKRMAYVLGLARFPKHVDYLCYTREEFARIKETSSVVHSALDGCAELTAAG